MKTLWPYYSTKRKAFYRDGKKRATITRINKRKQEYRVDGDILKNKVLCWMQGDTVIYNQVGLVQK